MDRAAPRRDKALDASVPSLVEDPELVRKRRSQIVAAATQLFSTLGFYPTTIKDIAKQAGISSGLVYQYVREKEDVLLLVLLDVINAYAREIPKAVALVEDPIGRLATTLDAYCRVIDSHRAAAVLAYRSTKSLSPPRRQLIQQKELETNALIVAEIKACQRLGLVEKVDPDILVYHFVMIAHGWALKSWYFKTRTTLDEYIRLNTDIIMSGILTSAGRRRYSAWQKRRPRGGKA